MRSRTQQYFFVHMQKTAGSALTYRLRRHFGDETVYPTPRDKGRPMVASDVDYLADQFARHSQDIRLITGHFPLCVTDILGADFATFTLLRDPVERTLSLLRHHRKSEPSLRAASLEQIYTEHVGWHTVMHNHMGDALTELVGDRQRFGLVPESG